jgi:outer membrane protein assembly factor BamE
MRTLFLCCALSLITGCGYVSFFPGVYRIDVEQGNLINQEMIDQLKPGMTTRQVQFILGTPLIQDSFNQSRWDYRYSIKNGTDIRDERRLTVFFENDLLTHFSSNYKPSDA